MMNSPPAQASFSTPSLREAFASLRGRASGGLRDGSVPGHGIFQWDFRGVVMVLYDYMHE